jgi:hypothetical protein
MTTRAQTALPALIVVVVALPIYILRLNSAVGLVVDDAWYVMLAKALADGRGYSLINAPIDGILPGYPPGFPVILSIMFQLRPDFPQNVGLLKSVSIVAMLGVGLLSYVYARRREMDRETAACIAAAVTITPAFVFLATSTLMTECVFTLLQLATVLLIHISGEPARAHRDRMLTVAAALTAAATVLIRSAGIALPLAVAVWLIKERKWSRAALFGVIAAVCLLPWFAYSRAHAPTPAEQTLHGGSIVYSYGEQIWMRWAGYPAAGSDTIRDLPARVLTNVADVVFRAVGGVFVPTIFRGPAESGEEIAALGGAVGLMRGSMGAATATMAISLVLSTLVLLGFAQTTRRRVTVAEVLVPISLIIILMWPFWTFRFVVPLTPFLFLYVVEGIRLVAPVRVAAVVLLCMIGLNVSDHTRYVIAARDGEHSGRVSWLAQARETDQLLEWVVANAQHGVIATTNPALVYLQTGRKTVFFDKPLDDWTVWRTRGVRYVISLVAVEPPPARGPYRLLYRSPGGLWVIEI